MTDGVHTSIEAELQSGRTVTYFTVGISMRPLLAERKTHVVIAPFKEAKNGDILLFKRENGVKVLHRCINQDKDFFYMRGDNTCGLEAIETKQVLGIVTHIYRKGKLFSVSESRAYRAYTVLWRLIYPCRWVVYKAKAAMWRLKCPNEG